MDEVFWKVVKSKLDSICQHLLSWFDFVLVASPFLVLHSSRKRKGNKALEPQQESTSREIFMHLVENSINTKFACIASWVMEYLLLHVLLHVCAALSTAGSWSIPAFSTIHKSKLETNDTLSQFSLLFYSQNACLHLLPACTTEMCCSLTTCIFLGVLDKSSIWGFISMYVSFKHRDSSSWICANFSIQSSHSVK